MPYDDDDDPFAGGQKTPSISFKKMPPGTTYRLAVSGKAKLLQSRDYDDNVPQFWDPSGKGKKTTVDTGQPVMAAVFQGKVLAGPQGVGEERSVWAQKPSALFAAVAEAQVAAGVKLGPGVQVEIELTGSRPHENPKMNDINEFAVRIVTGDAFGGNDEPAPF